MAENEVWWVINMKIEGKLKSKKMAVIISYLMVLMNTASNLVLTPVYLKYLGFDMYGLYQMVYAVAHYILILDFGIGTTMVRYISGYHAKNDYEAERNFSAHVLGIVIVIDVLIFIAGGIINSQLLNIYPTIEANESGIAHTIFMIMIATIAVTIIERYVQGSIMAYEHFVTVRAISLLKVSAKMVLTILMLWNGMGVIAIVAADLLVTCLSTLSMTVYSLKYLKFRVKFSRFDKILIGSICSFMFAIFLQSIVQYVNNVVDKTILGIMTTKADVAVYSVAMTFITLFNSLPSEISSVFLPQATKLVAHSDKREVLTNFVARPGRYQFMICGGIICGFFLFGREFITLWAGEDSINAWVIALVIMIPNMIPLIENTILSILDAKKKRLFRSLVLFGISIVNVIVSVILVSRYGMLGAPVGTALSFIVGYGIIMNIYYQKVIGIDVAVMFKNIFSKTWLCLAATSVITSFLNVAFSTYSWITLMIKIAIFCVLFLLFMAVYGFSEMEKNDISGIVKRIIRR